jgi:orotidine-5'-phosphate decarboxylase
MMADGILVNPYMGNDVIQPLMDHTNKAIVVLAKTSNPGGGVIQNVVLHNGQLLWEYILEQIVGPWNKHRNMIPVLAATANLDMGRYRSLIPNLTPILLAGVGTQGGNTSNVRGLLNNEGVGVFVNSSRGILYANTHDTWQQSVEAAAVKLKITLNTARSDK